MINAIEKTTGNGASLRSTADIVSLRNGVITDRVDRYQSIGDTIDQCFSLRFLLSSLVENLHLF